MATWLENISVLELSPVKRPANRKTKIHQKADWSAAFVNDLPDSAFLHIGPGGQKDDEGKTTPRRLRYFPVRDGAGKVDLPHVRNALSRIPQANIPVAAKDAARDKARRLLEQLTKSEDQMWIDDKSADAYLEKAGMPDLQKQAIKAAIAALNNAKSEMEPGMFKAAKGAMAKLLGFGKTEKSVEDAEAKVAELEKAAKEAGADVVKVAKSALDHLQAEEPAINDAVSLVAKLAGVTPTFKHVAALPPELKAQWEAMEKSRDDDRARLVELEKSIAAEREQATAREFVTKAEAFSSIPAKSDELGGLMYAVAKSGDDKAIACLDRLLKSTNEMARQSALFHDIGGGRDMPVDAGGTFGKIDALAKSMVEKSDKPLTIEQARTRVLEMNPRLFDEYNAAH